MNRARMNRHAHGPLQSPTWAEGIAAILITAAAIGSLAIAAQGLDGLLAAAESFERTAAPIAATPAIRAKRCAECGVIESTREIEAPDHQTGAKALGRIATAGGITGMPVRNYEITVRLQDGSRRVITDATPARWRHGERVFIIAGVD